MRETRVRAYRRGLLAETIAAFMLRLKGHRIVAKRYKTPVGEIDLVALKGRRLASAQYRRGCRLGRYRPSSGGASSELRNIGLPRIPTFQGMT